MNMDTDQKLQAKTITWPLKTTVFENKHDGECEDHIDATICSVRGMRSYLLEVM